MNNRKQITTVSFLFIISLLVFASCKKKKDEGTSTDQNLYSMAKETNGFIWFKNSSALLNKSAGSGHSQPLLRTRYNAIAATKLDSAGVIIPGSVFPEGSVIVKELHDDASTLGRYAVLYKKGGQSETDAKGWIWGYINADGSVAEPSANKGSACNGCHSQADNIDYMLMSKYFN